MKIELGKSVNLYPQTLINRLYKLCLIDISLPDESEANDLHFLLVQCIEDELQFHLESLDDIVYEN